MFPTPPNSSGVDENELPSTALVKNVNGVAGGSWQFTHNRALAAHDRINERRLTNVWATHNRNADLTFDVHCSVFGVCRRGETPFDSAQQVRNPAIMFRTDRKARL